MTDTTAPAPVVAPAWIIDGDGDAWLLDAEPDDDGVPCYLLPEEAEADRSFLSAEEIDVAHGIRERGPTVRIEPVKVAAQFTAPASGSYTFPFPGGTADLLDPETTG